MKKNRVLLFLLFTFYYVALQAENETSKPAPSSNILSSLAEDKAEEANIYLNFNDASLTSVVNFLAQQRKINLIPHKALEGIKVSLSTRTPLTLTKAWNILLTLLEANQFSIVRVKDDFRIVPNNVSRQQPLPIRMHDSEDLPESDIMIRYVYLFKNIRPENVRTVLDQLLSPGSVYYNNNLNACIISEKSLNIKTAMKIVRELDSGGLRESIRIIRLKEASAERIADFINRNLVGRDQDQNNNMRLVQPGGKQENSFFSKNIKAIPDSYNNTLILLGTTSGLQRIIDFVKKELDRPLEGQESRLHIKELKYTYAEKLKPLLDNVIRAPNKDVKGPIVGQVKYFEDMVIAAETAEQKQDDQTVNVGAGNRLIIACNKDDWTRIEAFIDKLDKPQPQVAMEILFVYVHLDENKELGAALSSKNAASINFETQHLAASGTTALVPHPGTQNMVDIAAGQSVANINLTPPTGSTFVTAGPAQNVWGIAQALLQGQNATVLSQPYLVANNHQKCTVEVTETRYLTGSIDPNSTTAVQGTDKVPAVTSVSIIPGINGDGLITLDIGININSFANAFDPTDAVGSGDLTTHKIQTKTTLADGEALIIGGLLQTTVDESIYKTPILGDIPIIGNLFRSRSQTIARKTLNVFIRPTLIKPSFEGGAEDYTQLKLDYSKIQIGRQADFLATNDPIQRWYFGTTQKQSDFQQIDDFSQTKQQPASVIVPIDPYYKTATSRTINRLEQRRKRLVAQEIQEMKKKESPHIQPPTPQKVS